MKKISFIVLFTVLSCIAIGQDSSLTYTKILNFDSVSKSIIYDKVLIWCSKNFKDSKNATNVKEREGGIIGGKGYSYISYRSPKVRGTGTEFGYFNDYYYDWLIEIKDNKLRITISNFILEDIVHGKCYVKAGIVPPFHNSFLSEERQQMQWKTSKEYLISFFERMSVSIYDEITTKKNDW